MGNKVSAKHVDSVDDVGEILDQVKRDINALKNFVAKRDVDVVRRSTKGLGTDEASLVNTLCNRTKKQLDAVDALYHETHESSLLRVVSEEVSGNFGKMVKFSLMETDDYGAEIYSLATEGFGTKENVLIDLVNTHTNEQLAAIKDKWEAKNNESMLDSINSELGGNAHKILLILLGGEKSESDEVDPDLATEQAAALYEAWTSKLIGTEEDAFLEILGHQSRAQIQEIREAFERDHGMSLMRAIHKGCRSTYERCLLGCLFPSSEAYTAYALFQAFEGMGTDEDRVTRLLGGTDKKKMAKVAAYYLDTYGKSLVEELKDELNGTFLKAAVSWAGGTDPTKGMEDVTAQLELEVEEDPSKDRDLTKAHLKERDNLRDFICEADAGDIRAACSGMGTNDRGMVSIICSRTKEHLARVDQHYHSMFSMSLAKQVKKECMGSYRELLLYTLMSEADFDALMLKESMDGLGTKEHLLILVLAPQTNARILAAKERHDEKYETPLIDRVQSDLHGSFEEVVSALLKGERQEDLVDEELAEQQAKELHDAGVGKRMGTDDGTFIRILTESSRPQIQLIRQFYEQNHEMSLERAIKKEFRGDMEKMMLALAKQPIAFYALQLEHAFDGLGTDKGLVARVLGGNDKVFVRQLDQFYLEMHDETLMEALKRETGGKFRRAALTWVCSSDPENPGNSLEEAFDGVPEDDGEEDREVEGEPEEEEEEESESPPSYEESHGHGPPSHYGHYQPPPPPHGYENYMEEDCGYHQPAGVGFMHDTEQMQRREPPPPPDDEEEEVEEDSEEEDDPDDDFSESLDGATEEQVMLFRRLIRNRRRALVHGHPGRVNNISNQIRRLKWEIQNNA